MLAGDADRDVLHDLGVVGLEGYSIRSGRSESGVWTLDT